jgi:PAS domain S-box-containing protein
LVGILYLENNLTRNVFTPARIAVLNLLASQAAFALQNARLYRELAEREAKIRRLVEANIIGIFSWDFDGTIIEANDEFLRIAGYDRDDLASGRLSWNELTPHEWLDRDVHLRMQELKTSGSLQGLEREYRRKDGSRVPVLIGIASFESGSHGVAFVLDLTERKRAEAAARDMQLELAHANRVATMGQLAASIAHEVKQPISGAVATAQAALRWLGPQSPDLEQARRALSHIIETGHRASDVVDRIRALIKKAPPRNEPVDINKAILEVVEISRSEAVNNDILVHTALADGLPLIEGDRIGLQQVLLNLIVNAIEAMSVADDGRRELLIRTQQEKDGVLVGVRDSGPGLAPEAAERLFDAFYTTKPGGLGMGLSICRSIIEAHGGRLWASTNVPHGTIFEFTVPGRPNIVP